MTNLSGTNLNNGSAVGPQGEGRESPSRFPSYPAYKDSDVDWCGVVPAEWQVMKLKRVARLQSGEFITSEAIEEEAQYPVYGGNGLRGYTTAHTHEGEYALVGRQGALCGNINYACGKFWASEHAVVVYPERGAVTRWLGELLRSMNLGQYSVSAAQPGLSVERIADLFIPVPSPIEQTQIARFLDHETARIDALIEEQQRLIELLKEKRQAVISQAVTKGLDPTVPMKGSGVEWLGEVPAHWQVGALGYFAGIDTGATPDRGTPEYWGGDIPWIKTGEVNYENISQSEEHITLEGVKNSAAKVAPKGTLLMAMYGQGVTRGRVAILDIDASYNQACAGIFVDSRIRVEYLRLFFIAAYPYVRDGGNETSQMNLSSGHIAKIKITVPPINEQMSVEHFLNKEMVRFDSLIDEAGLLANHLQERRSALISAAVTGKIDVRGWLPPASSQAHEPAIAEAV